MKVTNANYKRSRQLYTMASIAVLCMIYEIVLYVGTYKLSGYTNIVGFFKSFLSARGFFLAFGLMLFVIPFEKFSKRIYKIFIDKGWLNFRLSIIPVGIALSVASIVSAVIILITYFLTDINYKSGIIMILYAMWMSIAIRLGRLHSDEEIVNMSTFMVGLATVISMAGLYSPITRLEYDVLCDGELTTNIIYTSMGLLCLSCIVAVVISGTIIIYMNSKSLIQVIIVIAFTYVCSVILSKQEFLTGIVFRSYGFYLTELCSTIEMYGIFQIIIMYLIFIVILILAGVGVKRVKEFSKSKSEEVIAFMVLMGLLMLQQISEDIWYEQIKISRPMYNSGNIIMIMMILRTLYIPKSFVEENNKALKQDRKEYAGI